MIPDRIWADDLTGAAEVADAVARLSGRRVVLQLGAADHRADAAALVVHDLDLRHRSPAEAAAALGAALAAIPARERVFLKLDSQLHGPVGAYLSALVGRGRSVVLCAANPAAGRVTSNGRHSVTRPGGVTVTDLSDLLGGVPHELLPRGHRLPAAPARVLAADALDAGDLATLADAVCESGLDAAGSAAFLAALCAAPHRSTAELATTAISPRAVVAVVGSDEPMARTQVERCRAAGVTVIEVEPTAEAATVMTARDALGRGAAVVLTHTGRATTEALTALVSAAVEIIARADPTTTALLLTGGHTARRVLDRLDIGSLTLQPGEPGAVVRLRAPTGLTVMTKPGSYGDPETLVRLLAAAPAEGAPMTHATTAPIAVTMGDPAGVGPEICAAALIDPAVLAACRPVLIGDSERMRQAAAIMGLDLGIRVIEHPGAATPGPDHIDVIQVGELPADLPFGAVSPVAGDAAYRYIERAARYALAGEVSAIATAPINKAALHAAGHLYPGHTEMLAALTGVDEVSMMLTTPGLRVIHVTTHIGLIDAIERIDDGLVERTVRRGIDALQRAGIARPRVGVCAINPHAGEGGLFGRGEEATKIQPAIDRLQAQGHDVAGPLPADTAFYLSSRGEFDLVVAMYHDQGHGPVKVLGIEEGVNVTVGLPVIRTSVDHGTAFDIAGTGTVTTASMVQALLQAASLAARERSTATG